MSPSQLHAARRNRFAVTNATALWSSAGRPMGLALLAAGAVLAGCSRVEQLVDEPAPVAPRNAPLAQVRTAGESTGNGAAAPGSASLAGSGNPFSADSLAMEAERAVRTNLSKMNTTPADWVGATAAPGTGQIAARPMSAADGTVPIPSERNDTLAGEYLDGLTQVTGAVEGADLDPRLSRDGRWVVFASTQHEPTPNLYVKARGASTVTQLTSGPASDVMPAISPDGSRVAFASNRNGFWNIYLVNITGGQPVQLTTTSANELHPTWSPDGKFLAFCRLGPVSGRWELWVIEANKPSNAQFVGNGLFPEWAPVAGAGDNGAERILFQRARDRGDRAFALWTLDLKDGQAGRFTEVFAARGAGAINATWAPEGRFIAFSTVPTDARGRRSGTGADLWVVAADGSSRVNLTGGQFANLMPHWGSDNRLYFVSNRGGSDQVWSINPTKALAALGNTDSATTAGKNEAGNKAMATAAETTDAE